MVRLRRIYIFIRLSVIFFLPCLLFGCMLNIPPARSPVTFHTGEMQAPSSAVSTQQQALNLQKLCRVWGYVKYKHPVFLRGQKDWDAELLALLPSVSAAISGDEANGILHRWFIGLGTTDYGTNFIDQTWASAPEEKKIFLADTSWIADQDDLGQELSADLSELGEIPVISMAKAPVQFAPFGGCIFSNEKSYENMDYSDPTYRLLGLFRLWNAIEYYYPHLNLLDKGWHTLLLDSIPEMLEKRGEESYDRTLAALCAELHDAHVATSSLDSLLLAETGIYAVPVHITKADDVLVVERVDEKSTGTCLLMPGDVLLKLSGVDMETIVDRLKQIVSVPDDAKLLNQLGIWLLRSQEQEIELTVRRGGAELTLTVQGVRDGFFSSWASVERSHQLLEGNIGLINPSKLAEGELVQIMDEFSDTKGLIVDLRQYPKSYPSQSLDVALAGYLLDTPAPFVMWSFPTKTVPGVFLLRVPERSGSGLSTSPLKRYTNPVVLLMNEQTQSHAEYCVMSLRTGSNVAVIGENSIGADGNVAYLPLPDGDLLCFTGAGIYTPEGGQTQRVGLSPDIYVRRTITGICEGRDELVEAAILYIQKK